MGIIWVNSLFVLAVPFGGGNFFNDVVLPGVAGGFVFVLIANALLNHWGYSLW